MSDTAYIVYAHFQDEGFDYHLTAHVLAADPETAAAKAIASQRRSAEPLEVRVIELAAMPVVP